MTIIIATIMIIKIKLILILIIKIIMIKIRILIIFLTCMQFLILTTVRNIAFAHNLGWNGSSL